MRMLNSACAACTRLLKDCCARDRPDAADSADPGPCGPPNSCSPLPLVAAAPLCAIVAPAAMVAAAAPTCDKNARRLEPPLRRVSSVASTRKSSSTWIGRFDSDMRSSVAFSLECGLGCCGRAYVGPAKSDTVPGDRFGATAKPLRLR